MFLAARRSPAPRSCSGNSTRASIVLFFLLALAFGILMTLPIGGADMPVVISLYNAFTGLAVGFEGFVQQNVALIIAGTVVGAAGTLLTRLMAKAMNRSISNVLFSNFGGGGGGGRDQGLAEADRGDDAASLLYLAEKVIIVPGYGMAVAQAQHKIWELAQQLIKRDKDVKFAIHPVAGRMPGHMNVLLAEAGVPYDLIADMDDINPEFPNCDVAIVIGANDVVNPVAKTDKSSPIYGMPILDVANAKQVIVIKRGKGTGFAGIENALFYQDNCDAVRRRPGSGEQADRRTEGDRWRRRALTAPQSHRSRAVMLTPLRGIARPAACRHRGDDQRDRDDRGAARIEIRPRDVDRHARLHLQQRGAHRQAEQRCDLRGRLQIKRIRAGERDARDRDHGAGPASRIAVRAQRPRRRCRAIGSESAMRSWRA